jgi:hypothetical protein
MKKWVFGCLGLFLVLAAAGGYVAYRFVYLPGKAYVQSFTQLKVVPELNAQITNKSAYTPPADNVVSSASVERVVQVQRAVQTRMGERVKELEARFKFLEERARASGGEPSFREAVEALKEITALFIDAKKAQVDALNAQNISLAEYEWTRARAYEALGLPMDFTLQQIIRDVSAGKVPDAEALEKMQAGQTVEVPERNRDAVKPFAKELTDGAALAFFAL